jgi:hypothetical protein
MKREINCDKCADSWKITMGFSTNDTKEELLEKLMGHDEHIRIISGNLLSSCLCDGCGKELEKGTKANAVSVYIGDKYFSWENDYFV